MALVLEAQVLFFIPFCSITTARYGAYFLFQGKYDGAYPLFDQALKILQKTHGPEHPHVASTLNNMALVLEAQVLFFIPFCSITTARYGAYFLFQGKYDGAYPLFDQALKILQKTHGLSTHMLQQR